MQRWKVAVLVLCGLLAAVDVWLAAGLLGPDTADTAHTPVATGPRVPGPTTSAPTTSAPTTSAQKMEKVTIAAISDTRAWRAASPVRCSRGIRAATFGYSADGGKHWTTKKVPMVTVSSLSSVGDQVIATGTNSACESAAYVLSSTAAPQVAVLSPTWVVDPVDPTALMASGNRVPRKPCSGKLLDIAANSPSDVVALCDDHSVRHSTDKGASWQPAGGGSDAIAVARVSTAIYTASRARCGITVGALAGGRTPQCVAGTKKWSGPADMTIVNGTIWLASSDRALTKPLNASS